MNDRLGHLLGPSHAGALHTIFDEVLARALDRATGDRPALTPPVTVNGKVFVGTAAGELYSLSEQTGEVLWKVELGKPISFQPTVANGRIYVGTDRGSLFCLTTGDLSADGWLMWGATASHNGSDAR